MPETFVLPRETESLLETLRTGPRRLWIVKPVNRSWRRREEGGGGGGGRREEGGGRREEGGGRREEGGGRREGGRREEGGLQCRWYWWRCQ